MAIQADLTAKMAELQTLLLGHNRVLDIERDTGWVFRTLQEAKVIDAAMVQTGNDFVPVYFVARFPVGWTEYPTGVQLMAVTGWKMEEDHVALTVSSSPAMRLLREESAYLLYHEGVKPEGYDEDVAAAAKKERQGATYPKALGVRIAEFTINIPGYVAGLGGAA